MIIFGNFSGKIDFIKMDIQGAEPEAIEGMRLLLQKNNSWRLVTEFWPYAIESLGAEPRKFLSNLSRNGFVVSEIIEHNGCIEPITDLDGFLRKYTPQSQLQTNLLVEPSH